MQRAVGASGARRVVTVASGRERVCLWLRRDALEWAREVAEEAGLTVDEIVEAGLVTLYAVATVWGKLDPKLGTAVRMLRDGHKHMEVISEAILATTSRRKKLFNL